jgi:hypothetical protein
VSLDRRQFLAASAATIATPILGACSRKQTIPVDGVPRSDFDRDSTAEDVTEGIDLKGKIALVTGCTSGIGFETMRVLAKRGCYVIGTGRTLESAQRACATVVGTHAWKCYAARFGIRRFQTCICYLRCQNLLRHIRINAVSLRYPIDFTS